LCFAWLVTPRLTLITGKFLTLSSHLQRRLARFGILLRTLASLMLAYGRACDYETHDDASSYRWRLALFA
jgi:hypothetical protein